MLCLANPHNLTTILYNRIKKATLCLHQINVTLTGSQDDQGEGERDGENVFSLRSKEFHYPFHCMKGLRSWCGGRIDQFNVKAEPEVHI